MPLIEAALAFAITMLALSLIVSSLVEIIHRTLKLREQGLEYMLRQLFDQVLVKYVQPLIDAHVRDGKPAEQAYQIVRDSFIKRMTANRAPMGLTPDPRLAANAAAGAKEPPWRPGNVWGGRRVVELSPTDFMERLGSIDIGAKIKEVADAAAPGGADAVIRDIAQKFDGFGRDAATYFQGRARMLSVVVAIVLAFAVHVDAIDLFRTYLRDPNARAKLIEQSQAVTAQYKAAKDAVDAIQGLAPAPKAQQDPGSGGTIAPGTNGAATSADDVRKEVEALRKDALAAIANVNSTVADYAGLGAPLGWTTDRVNAAHMWQLVWTCKNDKGEAMGLVSLWTTCRKDDEGFKAGPADTQFVDVWVEVPRSPSAMLYLLLGGLLIGLGSPFWYDAVTSLTNLRSAAQGKAGPPPAQAPAAAASDKAQPVTPVGAFDVAQKAAAIRS